MTDETQVMLLVHRGNVILDSETGRKRCVFKAEETVDPLRFSLVCESPHEDEDFSYICIRHEYCRCSQ